jgi:hypothetical protein
MMTRHALALAAAVLFASTASAESEVIRLARALTAQVLAPQDDHGLMIAVVASPSVRAQVEAFAPDQAAELERVMKAPATDPNIAAAAAFALFVAEPARVDSAVEGLLVQMDRMMFFDPHLAQQLITEIGTPAVPTLVKHLDEGMVIEVVRALGPQAKSAVPALIERLGTGNVDVAAALAAIGTSDAIAKAKPVLINALEDVSSPLAKPAVETLGGLGTHAKEAIPAVRRALKATDPDTRMFAAIALVEMGDMTTGVQALGELIRVNAVENEFAAFEELRMLGAKAKAAREALLDVARTPDAKRAEERVEAVSTLLAVDPKNPVVIKALQDLALDPTFTPLLAGHPDILEQLNKPPIM